MRGRGGHICSGCRGLDGRERRPLRELLLDAIRYGEQPRARLDTAVDQALDRVRRQDYFLQGTRGWLRLHEKGGKRHDVPAHHRAEAAVEAYRVAGGLLAVTDEATAERFYQRFKWNVIPTIEADRWALDANDVLDWLELAAGTDDAVRQSVEA